VDSFHPTTATVLVVDDSADTRTVLRKLLEGGGCLVLEAANGQEAVESAKHQCPDLIIMDLNMPHVDGLSATEQIRSMKDWCAGVPIIAVTAYHAYGIDDAALEAGCNEYLVKPFDFAYLVQVLRKYLGLNFLRAEQQGKAKRLG
jgi:CheY-like chemotaxis protein